MPSAFFFRSRFRKAAWSGTGGKPRAQLAKTDASAGDNGNQKARTAQAKLIAEATHWKKSIVVNGVGAAATLVVLVVLVITKFMHGAWIVVVLIPLLVGLFRAIHHHYRRCRHPADH